MPTRLQNVKLMEPSIRIFIIMLASIEKKIEAMYVHTENR